MEARGADQPKQGEDMLITAVIEPEQSAAFQAYLVVSPRGNDGASEPDNEQ